MGTRPTHVLLSLVLPNETRDATVRGLAAGFGQACARYEVGLLGGNVAAAACLIELTFLNGRARLDVPVETLMAYDD